jgi:hypothetical protein
VTKITLIKTANGQFELKGEPSSLLINENNVAVKSLEQLSPKVFCIKTEDKIYTHEFERKLGKQ